MWRHEGRLARLQGRPARRQPCWSQESAGAPLVRARLNLAQDLALAGVVGGADDAFFFHALDQACGAVVADLELPLDEARRGLALTQHNLDRLAIETAVFAFLAVPAQAERIFLVLVLRDLLDVS